MNMNTVLAAAAAGALVCGSVAHADVMSDVSPYIGAELSVNSAKYKDITGTFNGAASTLTLKSKTLGLGFNIGARICDYFGVEAGYTQHFKAKGKDALSDISVKVSNMYLDGMGYFAASPEVDFIAAVGVGRMKPKLNGFVAADDSVLKAKTSYRLGVGAQYKFDENVAARLMFRTQKGNSNFLKNLNSVALGVAYTF